MNKLQEAAEMALEALEEAHVVVEHKQDQAKRARAMSALRHALAQPEQSNSIWVLTEEVNDYDQYGEYFVGAWNKKPTHQMLSALGVPQNRLRHVLNGGGRVGNEDAWFYLKEIEHE